MMVRLPGCQRRVALLVAFLIIASSVNAQTVPTFDGAGNLTGAKAVNVLGTLYDVAFVDGTCVAVFGGCDEVTDFTFHFLNDAKAGAQAVVDFVVAAGFGNKPKDIFGCVGKNLSEPAYVLVPWSFRSESPYVWAGMAEFYASSPPVVDNTGLSPTYDTASDQCITWAVFTPAVPPAPVDDIDWVSINDSGGGFTGQMSKYETTNAQYCQFLNAALASGDITVDGDNMVHGANGSNSGADFEEAYYDLAGAGWDGHGVPNGGAARINYSGGAFAVDSGFDDHPVTYVSWYGATAFCNYYGYRLPTEWEWQAVADYDGSYTNRYIDYTTHLYFAML
jgi:hypothetical protein